MGSKKYFTDEERCEACIKRILDNTVVGTEKLIDEQIQALKEYKDFYENKESDKHRGFTNRATSLNNTLQVLRRLGAYLKKPYKKATQKDLLDYLKFMRTKYKPSSIQSFKTHIRSFYRFLYGISKKHMYPEVVDCPEFIPRKVKNTYAVRDLPTADEFRKVLDVCSDDRDRLILSLAYCEGLRAGEVITLKMKSVIRRDESLYLQIEKSKTKTREVELLDSKPYLESYLKIRTDAKPNDHLIVGKYSFKGLPLSSRTCNELSHRMTKRAGLDKKFHYHLLRHKSITELHKDNLNTSYNASYHGISRATLESVYIHYDDSDTNKAVKKSRGKETESDKLEREKDKNKTAPVVCWACDYENPAGTEFCKRCKRIASKSKYLELENKKKQELPDQISALLSLMKDNPNFIESMKEKLKN